MVEAIGQDDHAKYSAFRSTVDLPPSHRGRVADNNGLTANVQSLGGPRRATTAWRAPTGTKTVALWAAWLWLRDGVFEGWRLAVTGGLAVLALGVLVDVYWHQTHPMVTDTGQYVNTLTLPGHQLQLLGFVIGCVVGAIVGASSWRVRGT